MIARSKRNVRGRGQDMVRMEETSLFSGVGQAGHILGATSIGLVLGVTLGAIAGSLRLAVGFGIGFGLLSGLAYIAEVRRGDAM